MLWHRKSESAKVNTKDLLQKARRDGFARVRIDGKILDLDDPINLDKKLKHTIAIVVDRLVLRDDVRTRVAESVETTACGRRDDDCRAL